MVQANLKVVITVEGGVVQGVMSNDKDLKVHLIDHGNIEQAENPAEALLQALDGIDDCVHEVL